MSYSPRVVSIYNVLVDFGIPVHRDTISRVLSQQEGWDTWDVESVRSGRTNSLHSRVGRALKTSPGLFREVSTGVWWLVDKQQGMHHEYFELPEADWDRRPLSKELDYEGKI